jgi:predicted SAM-dependent methyltransferase
MAMFETIKSLLPVSAKQHLRTARKALRYRARRVMIARAVRQGAPLRIIVGAAETWQPGWYSTNEQWLDITKASDWRAVFGGKKILSRVVAEHVFEHLTEPEALAALSNIADHMVGNGRIRIAVPDGFHPDPTYIRHVGIGGIGDDAADHKALLNVETLSELMRRAGFTPHHIEGYDRARQLVTTRWSSDDGYIQRSRQNPDGRVWDFPDASTSLIVDGVRA